ncbi:MFS transporter [Streptomyces cinerochromogenes]|uniref:MFS transporter n=1 Tax=Streptomyces cinerochromogenes TaxID=66422 RepID=UPI0033BA87AB
MDSPPTAPAAPASAPARFRWGPYASVFLLLFLFGTETFLVSPLLPTIADDLGISEQSAAYSVTAYVLVYAVCAPFLGLLSDRMGRRRTLLLGSVLFLLSNVAAALSDGLTLLVLSRALAGLAAAAAGPAIWAHIAETTEDTVRGRALGLGMAFFSCGQVLGVPLGSFLAGAAGWRAAFWAMAAGTLLVVPMLLKQIPASAARAAGGLGVGAVFAAWGHPALRKALLVNTAFNAANLGAYTFMGAVLAERFDLSVSALGLVGILVGLGSVVGSTAGGRLGDRARAQGRTHLPMLAVWGLLLAAGVALTVWGPGLVLALVGVALWFLASGGFVTDQQTLAGTAAPELRATSSAWLTSTMYAGTGVGAWVIGRFSDLTLATAVVGVGLALVASLGGLLVSTQLRRDTDSRPLVDAMGAPKEA